MLTFKQRYRPKTEREYTKTDLTVYDSAGNTALRGLKVYGKSEVVDGAIVSAGEGWSTVDLGTLSWTYTAETTIPTFGTDISDLASSESPLLCALYTSKINRQYIDGDMQIARWNNTSSKTILITNSNYTDATAFKNAMSGVLLCYQLADPTQGNAIAIKTDNGSGIDGTMATFSTGTPLRGIPDTTVRDVMAWNGSAGTVTKNCGKVDLGTLTWNSYLTDRNTFVAPVSDIKHPETMNERITGLLCENYALSTETAINWMNDKTILRYGGSIYIRDTSYSDPAAFKTALSGVMLVYELATPTTEPLSSTENASIAGLRTFDGTTHFTNNAATDMTVNYMIKVPTI